MACVRSGSAGAGDESAPVSFIASKTQPMVYSTCPHLGAPCKPPYIRFAVCAFLLPKYKTFIHGEHAFKSIPTRQTAILQSVNHLTGTVTTFVAMLRSFATIRKPYTLGY
jgi:hypothetical protein